MAVNPESRENFKVQDTHRSTDKPAIDPSQFWNEGNQIKLTLPSTTPEALIMHSPYGKDVVFANGALDHNFFNKPQGPTLRDLANTGDFAPKANADSDDAFKPRALFDQKDVFMAKSEDRVPSETDPRPDSDKRDSEAMSKALKSGNLEDLQHLVADMSPDKLKRMAEQLKSNGFDIDVSKDGKFTLFDKKLGLGVSIDKSGNAEVVQKDGKGHYVKFANSDPQELLEGMSSAYQRGTIKWEVYSAEYVGGGN